MSRTGLQAHSGGALGIGTNKVTLDPVAEKPNRPLGLSDEEIHNALNVALTVGGSIIIAHLRHAYETLDLLRSK
jgi:hypothetical protein